MKHFLGIILAFAITHVTYGKQVVVCDIVESTPIAGASVISSNGLILGATDKNGHINASNRDFPLEVRCLGYEAYTADNPTDSILLMPASYELPEAVISTKERPIIRVLAYAREYCTGATGKDTTQFYAEYMLEYFFADGKVKGYSKSDRSPSALAAKRYARLSTSTVKDSVWSPKALDDASMLSCIYQARIPYRVIEETENIRLGAATDTVMGKYWPKRVLRNTNNYFIEDFDYLADDKDHRTSWGILKLLGLTMEFNQLKESLLYKRNALGKYGLNDFVYGTYYLQLLVKGKLFKEGLGIKDDLLEDSFVELYPVNIERLTVDEYKTLKKDDNRPRQEFIIPDFALPVAAPVQELINRVKMTSK